MLKITIPTAFAQDREGRDLDNGEGRWTSKGYVTSLNDEQLKDLWSDADLYADGVDQAPLGVILSARATLRAIKRAQATP